jgi:hypothetical protein
VLGGVALVWLTFAVYGPCLDGEFISDDLFYIESNPHIKSLGLDNLRAIVDPNGPAAVLTLNYAPVNLLAHALEWQAFGPAVHGYHVVNVWLHIGASLLCALFLRATGARRGWAFFGGLVFLLHPANVESVAWIFQLKTLLSTGLGLAALLVFKRSPATATLLFALGLLTKISAAFALPTLGVMLWCSATNSAPAPRERGWLAAWCVVFVSIALPVWGAIERTSVGDEALRPEGWVQLRTIVAVAMRYLVMAATSHGVSAFQAPPPAAQITNPWWLGGCLALAILGGRLIVTLRRKNPEAIHWTLALAAFVPVSQIIPFRYPVADHYLYAMLPGLIGAPILILQRAVDAGERRADGLAGYRAQKARLGRLSGSGAPGLVSVALALWVGVALTGFAFKSHARAGLWSSGYRITQDSARHFPDGLEAHHLAAWEAARVGDAEQATASLRRAVELGFNSFGSILSNPTYRSVRDDPAFRAVVNEMAASWIRREAEVRHPTQLQLQTFANAYFVHGDIPASIVRLERALEVGGALDPQLQRELDQRKLQQRLSERLGPPDPAREAPH